MKSLANLFFDRFRAPRPSAAPPVFTAHNIRLDNGVCTRPEAGATMEAYPWFVSAKRVLETVFPGDRRKLRVADLGCLEGGYAVEFARMGFQVLGLDVRKSNIAACQYVKQHTDLPNLSFVRDDAWNIGRYGRFDAVFCCGLLYHLDRPRQFLQLLSQATARLLIVQTHFSTDEHNPKWALSEIVENEGLKGRWFVEFRTEADFRNRENARWSSWDNKRSFWIDRACLIQAIRDAGFDLVMEQYDGLGADIADAMTRGYYKTDQRGTFVGVKT